MRGTHPEDRLLFPWSGTNVRPVSESRIPVGVFGLGIGLTVAKNLVQMHGGVIQAFSDGPGTGAEFVVMLPVREEKHANTAC